MPTQENDDRIALLQGTLDLLSSKPFFLALVTGRE